MFGIGINHAAKPGFLDNAIVQGSVTLGIGDNKELGGANVSAFGFQGTLGKPTVLLDGRTLISEGKLVL